MHCVLYIVLMVGWFGWLFTRGVVECLIWLGEFGFWFIMIIVCLLYKPL